MLTNVKKFVEDLEEKLGGGVEVMFSMKDQGELRVRVTQWHQGLMANYEHTFKRSILLGKNDSSLVRHLTNHTVYIINKLKADMR